MSPARQTFLLECVARHLLGSRGQMYAILATLFFLTLTAGAVLIVGLAFKAAVARPAAKVYVVWIAIYLLFIAFGTGPVGARLYVPPTSSPYKLPWRAGISRFVSQGNRSFTSHRG